MPLRRIQKERKVWTKSPINRQKNAGYYAGLSLQMVALIARADGNRMSRSRDKGLYNPD